MAAYYYKGLDTGRTYQFWVGNGGADTLPPGFVDPYGNPRSVVTNYNSPDGTIETVVVCLPFGMVQLGTAGPPPPDNVFRIGHNFSPWEQLQEP